MSSKQSGAFSAAPKTGLSGAAQTVARFEHGVLRCHGVRRWWPRFAARCGVWPRRRGSGLSVGRPSVWSNCRKASLRTHPRKEYKTFSPLMFYAKGSLFFPDFPLAAPGPVTRSPPRIVDLQIHAPWVCSSTHCGSADPDTLSSRYNIAVRQARRFRFSGNHVSPLSAQ
jgi:hypothetical protein